jgi:hypothetical protein
MTAQVSLSLGIEGFSYADLFVPERLAALHARFLRDFESEDPSRYVAYAAYAKNPQSTSALDTSNALIGAAPYAANFVARLFGVENEASRLRAETESRAPLWKFKREFVKKRVHKPDASKGLDTGAAIAFVQVFTERSTPGVDEELAVARTVLSLWEVDEVARKALKGGGAQWTDVLRAIVDEARTRAQGIAPFAFTLDATDEARGNFVAQVLTQYEAALVARHANAHDSAHAWPTLKVPRTLDYAHLVHIKRPD